jgi:FixJ family two-component response regulator
LSQINVRRSILEQAWGPRSDGTSRLSSPLAAPAGIVFVIDDDEDVLAALKFSLEIEGFAVEVFRTAGTLLERTPLPSPACLVVDYRLPDMDGLEMIRRLRSLGIDLPAILITTDPAPRVRDRAAALGVGIIEKPLLGNALAEAIRAVLR